MGQGTEDHVLGWREDATVNPKEPNQDGLRGIHACARNRRAWPKTER